MISALEYGAAVQQNKLLKDRVEELEKTAPRKSEKVLPNWVVQHLIRYAKGREDIDSVHQVVGELVSAADRLEAK